MLNLCFSELYGTSQDAPARGHGGQVSEGHLKPHQRQVRFDAIELAAQRAERLGETARRDDDRHLRPRPALLDPPHDAIDRIGLTEHDAGTDAVLRSPADDVRRTREFRCRELRRSPDERLEGCLYAGRDDAADKNAIARYAVEGGGRSHVDDDGVAFEEAARGEGVDESIGADREWLVDVDADRQRGARIDEDHRTGAQRLACRDERIRQPWYDRPDRGTLYSIRAESVQREQAAQQNAEFIGGAVDARDDSPVAAQRIALEQTNRGLGIPNVEHEDHAEPPSESLPESRTSEPACSATRPSALSTSSAPSTSIPATVPLTGATHRWPAARSRSRKRASSPRLRIPGAAAAPRNDGTIARKTLTRSLPAASAAASMPSAARTLMPTPTANQSRRGPRQRASTSTPASFFPPMYKSLGHLSSTRLVLNASSAGASDRARRRARTPNASSPGGRSRSVSQMPAPGSDRQDLRILPRPAVCASARMSVPAGAPSSPSSWATSSVDATSSNTTTRGSARSAANSSPERPS